MKAVAVAFRMAWPRAGSPRPEATGRGTGRRPSAGSFTAASLGAGGPVALSDPCPASVRDLDALRSDCRREIVEDRLELVVVVDVGGDVVVAAAHILHEGVTGGEDPC
jgi:hypothetical protein